MVNVGPLVPLSMENAEAMRERMRWDPGMLRPDPRISNQPPAWLADRSDWHDVLDGMSIEDCDWIGDHWRMATEGQQARKTRRPCSCGKPFWWPRAWWRRTCIDCWLGMAVDRW